MEGTAIRRIPELDGIRGVAIGMILLFHYLVVPAQARPGSPVAYALVPLRLSWSGVDLFFVLSGFLIGGILLDARDAPNYFRTFYTRRFLRIVPIYAVLLGVFFALSGLVQRGAAPNVAWMTSDQLPWFAYVTFLQNIWMAAKSTHGAFGLVVTWSLAVEEQFYLTVPALIRKLDHRGLARALLAGIVLAPILRSVLFLLWPQNVFTWFFLTPCRADALLLGVLGAVALRDARCRGWVEGHRAVLRGLLTGLGLGTLALAVFAPAPHSLLMATAGLTWLATFYLTVLLYGVSFRNSTLSECLRWTWLRSLGAIAYGTYLFHELVLGALHGLLWSREPRIDSLSGVAVSGVALGVTLLGCSLSWVYFERPLVQIGHRVTYGSLPRGRTLRPQR